MLRKREQIKDEIKVVSGLEYLHSKVENDRNFSAKKKHKFSTQVTFRNLPGTASSDLLLEHRNKIDNILPNYQFKSGEKDY